MVIGAWIGDRSGVPNLGGASSLEESESSWKERSASGSIVYEYSRVGEGEDCVFYMKTDPLLPNVTRPVV